jgi:hypothetical protein
VQRLWIMAAAALLTACGAGSQVASCSPCPGPGFVASGIPSSVRTGGLEVCVADEPCTRSRLRGPIPPMSQQLIHLADGGRSWEEYDGSPVTVTITSEGDRWQGSGSLDYTDGGDGICSCSNLVADVALHLVSRRG